MNDLRDFTERFWRDTANLDPLLRLQQYIRELLPKEMEHARANNRQQRLPGRSYDVLALLVGHAFEPLLQSICAYKPTEVLLVLNHWYTSEISGNDMARRLNKLLPDLKGVDGLETPPTVRLYTTVDDTPSAVFQYLLARLQDDWAEKRSVVVDITGAKKSMVAGAFFFAAYANLPISYVDFDEYSERYNRPYGYTCNIGLIDNPYRDFHLRDWARVRRLYRQYAFGAARNTLRSVQQAMERSGYFTADQIAAANQLVQVLEVYEHWDNGNYSLAKRRTEQLKADVLDKLALPTAIQVLGDEWPHGEETASAREAAEQIKTMHGALELGDPAGETTFYTRLPLLAVYIRDELARIGRLIALKEDFRSAFLRSAAVLEVLFYARLFTLWKRNELRIELGDDRGSTPLPERGSRLRSTLYSNLIKYPGETVRILMALRWRPEEPDRQIKVKAVEPLTAKEGNGEIGLRRDAHAPVLDKFWGSTPLGDFNLLRELRNKAIHTYLSVPHKVADAALKMAQASWHDFETRWIPLVDDAFRFTEDETFEAADWNKLCLACGIDFLPTYQEEDE
jgi:hypothetical protein